MPKGDYSTFLIIGGVFIIVGIILYFWGKYEESKYYNSISHRYDVREYLERRPKRPEPAALKIGSKIAFAVGIVMLALGGVFWRWG